MYLLMLLFLGCSSMCFAMEEGAALLGKRDRSSLLEENHQRQEEKTAQKKVKSSKEHKQEDYIYIKATDGKKIALPKIAASYASVLQTPFPENTFSLPFPKGQVKPVLKALVVCNLHETIKGCQAKISRLFAEENRERMYEVADFLGSDKILDSIALLYANEMHHDQESAFNNLNGTHFEKILEMKYLPAAQQQNLLERIKRCYFIFHHKALLQEPLVFNSISFSALTVHDILRFKAIELEESSLKPEISSLCLSNYKLKSLDGIERIPNLEMVKTLHIYSNELTTLDLALLQKHFPRLKRLNVSHNKIDTIVGSFATFPNLEVVVLQHNKLQRVAEHFKNATSITCLLMDGNLNLSDEEQNKIKEYLPTCFKKQ